MTKEVGGQWYTCGGMEGSSKEHPTQNQICKSKLSIGGGGVKPFYSKPKIQTQVVNSGVGEPSDLAPTFWMQSQIVSDDKI